MKGVLAKLCHALVVVALLHGQLAFAVPGVPTLFGPGCSTQMAMADGAPGQHHGHDAPDGARSVDQESLSGFCLDDECCKSCSSCGHCSTALVSSGVALTPPAGEAPADTAPRPSQFHTSPKPHPPRAP